MAGSPLARARARVASTLAELAGRLDPGPPAEPTPVGHSRLPAEALATVHAGTLRYTYKDRPFPTSPFDLALLQVLIARTRPSTILEVGGAGGGRALWFADQLRAHGIAGTVVVVHPDPPSGIDDHAVAVVAADPLHLDESPLAEVLAECARPLLVVEDGPHTREACLAVLGFVHPHLRRGEYVVVSGGIVQDLGLDRFEDGPHRAVLDHLRANPGGYTVDRELCDWFGRNATWNPDGYLRRE